MDHNNCIYIDAGGMINQSAMFLRMLTQIKAFKSQETELSTALRKPAIEYRGMQIQGFWPSITYLNSVRPCPEVMPGSPERKAIIQSLVEVILADAQHLQQLTTLYRLSSLPFGFVTLLELAIATFSDTSFEQRYPWITDVNTAVHDAIVYEHQQEDIA